MPAALARQPYALESPAFPFVGLANAAARAPLGGERESALACFTLARICLALLPPMSLTPAVRSARSAAAKSWLSSLALPPALRASCVKLADAAAGDAHTAASALSEVTAVTAATLDAAAHLELLRLAERLRG